MKNTMIKIPAALTAAVFSISLAACAGDADNVATNASNQDYYAAAALAAEDWATAARKLESRQDQDPYRLLNLALAYQNLGRDAEAIALYQQVLELQRNPYANLGERIAPRRVKSLAKDAMLTMSEDSSDQP